MFLCFAIGCPFSCRIWTGHGRVGRGRTKPTGWMSGIMAANYACSRALKHSFVKTKQNWEKRREVAHIQCCFILFSETSSTSLRQMEDLNAQRLLLWHAGKCDCETLITCEISRSALYTQHVGKIYIWTEHENTYTKYECNQFAICSNCCIRIWQSRSLKHIKTWFNVGSDCFAITFNGNQTTSALEQRNAEMRAIKC